MADQETQDILAQIEQLYQNNSATGTVNNGSSANIPKTGPRNSTIQQSATMPDKAASNPQIIKKRILNLSRNRPVASPSNISGDKVRNGPIFNDFKRPLLDENTSNTNDPNSGLTVSPSPMSSTELNLNVSSHSSQAQTIQSGPPPVINRAIVPSTHNTILVSKRQKGNPVLLHIRGTAWEYSDIVPDYITGLTSCVLFLSLKYHRIHPEYIHNRMSKLGNLFTLRTLLVVIDIENHPEPIKELTKVCVIRGYTLVLAWSASEAGDYISKFKVLENIAPVGIQGFMKEDYSIRITEVLNSVRGINKNDAISLISTFGSLKEAILDAGDSVETIGGWGETKARRFKVAVTEPFIYNKKYKKVRHEESNVEDPQIDFDII